MTKRFVALAGLILIAVFSRFLPHPWNWTAIGAAALLGGARFEKRWEAVLVPVAALVLSDLILGFHELTAVVYGAFALIALGAHAVRGKITGWRIGSAALVASVFFFLVTNFAVWAMGSTYSPNLSGLMASYLAGLPFLASQALGDVFYSAILFTLWDQLEARAPALVKN